MNMEMGFRIRLLGLCLCMFLVNFSFIIANTLNERGDVAVKGTVFINGESAIATIDDDFVCATLDWWPPQKCDYGRCSWGLASLLNLDLNNKILLNAVKAFSPLKLRLGGSLQDKLVYGTEDYKKPCTPFVKNETEMFRFTQGCLPMHRWDELNSFFRKAGVKIIFGLNALAGRSINSSSAVGPWDHTNAESFIRYTVGKNYSIHGWELGNELSGSGIGTSVSADQYALDVKALKALVQTVYRDIDPKPLVIAPGGFFDATWFKEFINKSGGSIDVVTHHIYNLGPGVDEHLVEKILDPSYLDGEASTFSSLQNITLTSPTSATAWVGESGGAYNSGHHLVSDAFVYSFWYLDQLGMSASFDTKTYCRQTLIGGNYGLLNTTNFTPNPDYYSALLWHRLMGRHVLSTSYSGTKIRAYAHCAKQSKGITLLLLNLDNSTTVQAKVSFNRSVSLSQKTKARHQHHHRHHHHNHHHKSKLPKLPYHRISERVREEYHLKAKDGDLHSQIVLLNGNILTVNSTGDIPGLVPLYIGSSKPILIAPLSIVFIHMPYVVLPACR